MEAGCRLARAVVCLHSAWARSFPEPAIRPATCFFPFMAGLLATWTPGCQPGAQQRAVVRQAVTPPGAARRGAAQQLGAQRQRLAARRRLLSGVTMTRPWSRRMTATLRTGPPERRRLPARSGAGRRTRARCPWEGETTRQAACSTSCPLALTLIHSAPSCPLLLHCCISRYVWHGVPCYFRHDVPCDVIP